VAPEEDREKVPAVPPVGSLDISKVLESPYFFH